MKASASQQNYRGSYLTGCPFNTYNFADKECPTKEELWDKLILWHGNGNLFSYCQKTLIYFGIFRNDSNKTSVFSYYNNYFRIFSFNL